MADATKSLPGFLEAPPKPGDEKEVVLDLRDPATRAMLVHPKQKQTWGSVRKSSYMRFVGKQEFTGANAEVAVSRRQQKGIRWQKRFAARIDAAIAAKNHGSEGRTG
jgi:hypothetical protein